MNNKVIVASLSKIANELDSLGKFDEANEVTSVMVKVSQSGINETRVNNITPGDRVYGSNCRPFSKWRSNGCFLLLQRRT